MLNIGDHFQNDQYIILKKFTDSGFLIRYLAYMPYAERYTTIVILNPDYDNKNHVLVFDQFAKVTSLLNHNNIAKVYESGEDNGVHFYAQEYYLGTLKEYMDYLREQSVSSLSLLPIIIQICTAIEYCQGEHIVHGHLNTNEILLGENQKVSISNFYYNLNASNRLKTPFPVNLFSSTHIPLPPEVVGRKNVQINSDTYSIGCLAYYAVTDKLYDCKSASKSLLIDCIQKALLPQQLADLIWDATLIDPNNRLLSITPLKELLQKIQEMPPHKNIKNETIFQSWWAGLDLPDFLEPEPLSFLDTLWFNDLWQEATNNVEHEENLREALKKIRVTFCDVLWATTSVSEIEFFNGIYYNLVTQSVVKIKIPTSFPLIFFPFRTINSNQMNTIQDIVRRNAKDSSDYFAVIVPLFSLSGLEKLVRESVFDFVILNESRFKKIVTRINPPNQFRQEIVRQIDLVSLSPYITKGPVTRAMFFGREQEVKIVAQRIKDTSITIVGGRKIGKTSILRYMHQVLGEELDRHAVYLDCQAVNDYENFFELLDFETGVSIPDARPINFLKFLKILKSKYPNKGIVFLFDEVDDILNYDYENNRILFKLFRSLSQSSQCRFIFCGERELFARQKDPVSPFFNFCHGIFLRYLDRSVVTQIIVEPLRDLGLLTKIDDELCKRIFYVSSGHPNIVQYLCHNLVIRVDKTKERIITLADLTAIEASNDFFEYFLETIWGQPIHWPNTYQ